MECWDISATSIKLVPLTLHQQISFRMRLAGSSIECYLDIQLDFGKNLFRCLLAANEML